MDRALTRIRGIFSLGRDSRGFFDTTTGIGTSASFGTHLPLSTAHRTPHLRASFSTHLLASHLLPTLASHLRAHLSLASHLGGSHLALSSHLLLSLLLSFTAHLRTHLLLSLAAHLGTHLAFTPHLGSTFAAHLGTSMSLLLLCPHLPLSTWLLRGVERHARILCLIHQYPLFFLKHYSCVFKNTIKMMCKDCPECHHCPNCVGCQCENVDEVPEIEATSPVTEEEQVTKEASEPEISSTVTDEETKEAYGSDHESEASSDEDLSESVKLPDFEPFDPEGLDAMMDDDDDAPIVRVPPPSLSRKVTVWISLRYVFWYIVSFFVSFE